VFVFVWCVCVCVCVWVCVCVGVGVGVCVCMCVWCGCVCGVCVYVCVCGVYVCVCVYKLSFDRSKHKSSVHALPFHSSVPGCPPCCKHAETFPKAMILYGELPCPACSPDLSDFNF